MQIFSKLQRNSINYFFIIFLVFLINILNSKIIFFPLFVGVFLYCSEFLLGVVFLILFCLAHNYNLFLFFIFYSVYKLFFQKFLKDFFDIQYVDIINIFLIYLFLFIYLYKIDFNFLFIYVLYNFSIDILINRIVKCKPKLFYL